MIKRVCNILSTILLLVLLALACLLFVPNLLGYQSFAIVSGSMEPAYPVGSIVYAKEAPFNELKEGDVISYSLSGDTKVTHRIVAIDEEKQQFTTKGDANNTDDGEPVSYKNVIGKVAFSVPYLGYLSQYIRTPLGIAIGCGVIFIMIILNFIPDILGEEDNKKNKEKK